MININTLFRSSSFLFVLCLVVSAPAWFLAKYQVKDLHTDPLFAVGLRMFLGGSILYLFQLLPGKGSQTASLTLRSCLLLLIQGVCLYSINFILAYEASRYMISGLIAVIFCAMILPNLLLGKLIFKRGIDFYSLMGAILGLIGVVLCFWPEFQNVNISNEDIEYGILLATCGMCFSIIGTQFSGLLSRDGMSSLSIVSRGMMIGGGLSLLTWAVFGNHNIQGMHDVSFWATLFYLAFVVTTVANILYVRLIQDVGPGHASFLWICLPVSCLAFSSLYENYVWTRLTVEGTILIVVGGVMMSFKDWFLKIKKNKRYEESQQIQRPS